MQQRTKIAIAVALALNAMTGLAQAQEVVQRVEVTGSRIRQVDLETAQPLQVMTQEQIQKTGLVTVGDILNNLSAAGTPAFSKGSTLGASREQGGQFANMRNLGAQRLLVLVNGKRWTATVSGYTDLSTIPALMIDRVEVLKDGASSIYGSDAIAGVVNIILKKTMEGGAASAYVGANDDKYDGKTKEYSLSYGANSDKGSLMFGLSHATQGEVWANARDITSYTSGPNHYAAGFGTGPWGRIAPVNAAGAAILTGATGFNRYLNHTGSFNGDGTGADATNAANYHAYTGAEADTFNSTSQMMFTSPSKLTTLFTKGELNLPWDTRLITTAMYSERASVRQVAGYPLTSTTQSKFPVYIDKNSYYNPLGTAAVGAAGQDLFFYRRTVEVPRVTDNENHTLHIDAALDGAFTLRGLPWNWNVGYNHSAITGTVNQTGNINLLALKKALGPSFLNPNGVVQCGTPTAAIPLAECVPFNILGGPSAANSAAFGYIMSNGQATYGSTVNSATADIGGELYALPAGQLAFAGGLEHRAVRGYDRPGQFEQSGYSTDLAGNSTVGEYTVKEAYLELQVPILKNQPFAELLNVNVASRYSDYSNFGSTTNSKFSFMWKPVKDLLFRGTYAEGFRAPTVGDTFGGGSQSYDSYLDTCDSLYGDARSNATTAANCKARGVPVTFRQVNQAGTPVGAAGAQTPVPFNTGAGNTSLTPETAVTRTFGFVYSPSYVTGLTVGVDYFDIRIQNRITAVGAKYEIDQCYVNNVQSFCDKIVRDPITGQIVSLSRGNANLGSLGTKGVDLSVGYRMPRTPYGQFGVRSETTYVNSYTVKSSDISAPINYAGESIYYRVKANAALDWSLGNWGATWTTRFYSSIKDRCWTVDPIVECSNPTDTVSWGKGYNRLGALVYNDLNVSYSFAWKGKLALGANNLFDKGPRITYSAASSNNGASSSSSVDPDLPLSRFIYARYSQSF
jgi:iron complex outermembrane receptor protein